MTPATLMAALRFVRLRSRDTAGRSQALFQLEKLSHEVKVRTYDRPCVFHQFVRLDHRETLVPHYVRDGDRRTTRNAGLTMHQDAATGFPCFLDEIEGFLEVLLQILMSRIRCRYLPVGDASFLVITR